jgi:hypothetical protein
VDFARMSADQEIAKRLQNAKANHGFEKKYEEEHNYPVSRVLSASHGSR